MEFMGFSGQKCNGDGFRDLVGGVNSLGCGTRRPECGDNAAKSPSSAATLVGFFHVALNSTLLLVHMDQFHFKHDALLKVVRMSGLVRPVVHDIKVPLGSVYVYYF